MRVPGISCLIAASFACGGEPVEPGGDGVAPLTSLRGYIVFVADGLVGAARPDGSEVHTWPAPVPGGALRLGIDPSPDGRQVLIAHQSLAGFDLFDVGGGTTAPVTVPTTEMSPDQFAVKWSPDGRRIAYHLGYRAIVADIAGTSVTNARLLLDSETAPLLRFLNDLDWSPEGDRIAIASDGVVFVFDTLTRSLTQVDPATPVSYLRDLAWSPDGGRFAFAFGLECCGKTGVGVMGTDGSGPLELASISSGSRDGNPSWSPDGTEIVFVRGGDLWIVPAAGGPAREVLHLQQWIRRAQWAW